MPHCCGRKAPACPSCDSCVPPGHSGHQELDREPYTCLSALLHRAELYAHCLVARSRFIIGSQRYGRSTHTSLPGRSPQEEKEDPLENDVCHMRDTDHFSPSAALLSFPVSRRTGRRSCRRLAKPLPRAKVTSMQGRRRRTTSCTVAYARAISANFSSWKVLCSCSNSRWKSGRRMKPRVWRAHCMHDGDTAWRTATAQDGPGWQAP